MNHVIHCHMHAFGHIVTIYNLEEMAQFCCMVASGTGNSPPPPSDSKVSRQCVRKVTTTWGWRSMTMRTSTFSLVRNTHLFNAIYDRVNKDTPMAIMQTADYTSQNDIPSNVGI